MATKKRCKKSGVSDINSLLAPEKVREWALTALMDAVDSPLDLALCSNHEYLSTLSKSQLSKIKKINFDREGNVCSVEPTPLVDLVVAAANIAGSKEAMKAKIEQQAKEEEQDGTKRYRSQNLNLSLISKDPSTESGKVAKKKKTEKNNSSFSDLLDEVSKKN